MVVLPSVRVTRKTIVTTYNPQRKFCKGNSHSQAPTCLVSFIIPLLFSYFTLRLPISHSLSLFFYFLAWYHDPLCSFMSYHVPLPLVITMDSFHLSIPYIPTASTLFYICLYYVSTSP